MNCKNLWNYNLQIVKQVVMVKNIKLIPIFYFSDPADAIQKAGKSSRTTHGHILIVDARKYMVGIIVVQ